MRGRSLIVSAFAAVLSVLALAAAAAGTRDLAIGRPYTLSPSPNYPLSTDPGDATQLTDGKYTVGRFWSMKSTVGWMGAKPVTITIDLGSVQPIGGISFNTAAGEAGVEWPASIFVLTSADGRSWTPLGDLVALDGRRGAFPVAGYAVHRFESSELHGAGRFVQLVVDGRGTYVFVDEVEVWSPAEATKRAAGTSEATTDTKSWFWRARTRARMSQASSRDVALARQRLASSSLDATQRRHLADGLAGAEASREALATPDPATFRAILPVDVAQARAFATLGAMEARLGAPALSIWAADPWDFLTPDQRPPASPGTVRVVAMNGETRAAALDLRNATEEPVVVHLRVNGLPGGPNPGFVSISSVAWTESGPPRAVATALLPAPAEAEGFRIEVPAGMTRQAWLSVAPRGLAPGLHSGTVEVSTDTAVKARVPLEVRVLATPFPAQLRLHIGGWDYTDSDEEYAVTAQNVTALIALLREHGVDSPWATRQALPYPRLDASGRLTAAPDTGRFDRWIARWPGARRYLVFANVSDDIGGIRRGSPAFAPAVAAWLRFWAEHAMKQGVRPEQIALLLVDEPHELAQEERSVAWANAVHAAGTGIAVWENPTREDPARIPPELVASVDALCANRTLGRLGGERYWRYFREQRAPGRTLEIYGGEEPAPLADPYSYFRLQAWVADSIGANGVHFWSFADAGGASSSWNEFGGERPNFSPVFLAPDSATSSKQLEAIREGAEDFEYLALLRERVEELTRKHPESAALSRARELARAGTARVLGAPGAADFAWTVPKDRSLADAVRIEIGAVLDELGGTPTGP